jgi:hypothetical protein
MAFLSSDEVFFLEPEFEMGVDDVEFWTLATDLQRSKDYRAQTDISGLLYDILPNSEHCDPGVISSWTEQNALEVLNAIRALNGLPQVTYDRTHAAEVQSAALVQFANEDYVGHYPEPDDRCYSQLAYDGASSSNLSYSFSNPKSISHPIADFIGWANDANNIGNIMGVGHRRWILHPSLPFAAYGNVFGFSSQKVFGFDLPPKHDTSFKRDFVAFPIGAFPYPLLQNVGEKAAPWSFHIAVDDRWQWEHDYFSDAAVSVVDILTGEELSVTGLYTDTLRFSDLHGNLSWFVHGHEYDTEYEVTVSDISYPTGEVKSFTYPVSIVRYEILDITEPLEESDSIIHLGLRGTRNGPDDRDSTELQIAVAGTYRLEGNSKFSNWGFYAEIYDDRKILILSTDEERNLQLSPGAYTLVVGRCNNEGRCYRSETLEYEVQLKR